MLGVASLENWFEAKDKLEITQNITANLLLKNTTSSSPTKFEALAINSLGNNEGSTFCSAHLASIE